MSSAEDQGPARPQRLKVVFERSGDGLGFFCRSLDRSVGGGLLLWLTAWTVACVVLGGMVLKDPKLFTILFALPFWASWLFVFSIVLKSFFQREGLLLDRQGAIYVRRVIVVPLKTRTVPLDEIQSFGPYSVAVDHESGCREWGIEMRTLGHSLRMVQGLSEPELQWLEFQLNDHLRQLRGGQPPAAIPVPAATPRKRARSKARGSRAVTLSVSKPQPRRLATVDGGATTALRKSPSPSEAAWLWEPCLGWYSSTFFGMASSPCS